MSFEISQTLTAISTVPLKSQETSTTAFRAKVEAWHVSVSTLSEELSVWTAEVNEMAAWMNTTVSAAAASANLAGLSRLRAEESSISAAASANLASLSRAISVAAAASAEQFQQGAQVAEANARSHAANAQAATGVSGTSFLIHRDILSGGTAFESGKQYALTRLESGDFKLGELNVILPPKDATNTGDFPAEADKSSPFAFTFAGATDADGTVTHYMVDQISSANLTVTAAEVAAGSAHEFTVGDISVDESVTFRVRAKDDAGTYSSGVTVTLTLKAVVLIGLLWNQTDDVYRRIGIGIDTSHAEFTSWLSTTAARQNDHDGPTPGTQVAVSALTAELNTNTRLPFASRARVVMANDGTKSTFDHSTAPSATEQIMTQTERYHYVQAKITADGKDYYLYAVSLEEFALDVESDLGLSTPTITVWDDSVHSGSSDLSSGSVSGSVITSVNHPTFVYHDDTITSWTYTGSFHSVEGRSTFGAGVRGTNTITRATARTHHAAFGAGFHQRDFWARSAGMLLALIERGTWWLEGSGTKWDGYAWNTTASSYDQDNGLTLSLGDETGVILDGSGRVIAATYRGEENYHSALWEFVDGINLSSGAVYLAKAGAAYADDTDASPYFDSGAHSGANTSFAYLSSHYPGLFIPYTSGGSSTIQITDQFVNGTGWRVLRVGGALVSPGFSGVACWNAGDDSSAANWHIVSRSCFRN